MGELCNVCWVVFFPHKKGYLSNIPANMASCSCLLILLIKASISWKNRSVLKIIQMVKISSVAKKEMLWRWWCIWTLLGGLVFKQSWGAKSESTHWCCFGRSSQSTLLSRGVYCRCQGSAECAAVTGKALQGAAADGLVFWTPKFLLRTAHTTLLLHLPVSHQKFSQLCTALPSLTMTTVTLPCADHSPKGNPWYFCYW